jgi:hypothetical protein
MNWEQRQCNAKGSVLRVYESLATHAVPLHKNRRSIWGSVSDQRPLVWNQPNVYSAHADYAETSYTTSAVVSGGNLVFASDMRDELPIGTALWYKTDGGTDLTHDGGTALTVNRFVYVTGHASSGVQVSISLERGGEVKTMAGGDNTHVFVKTSTRATGARSPLIEQSTIRPSPSHIARRGVVAAGSGAFKATMDGVNFILTTSNSGLTWTFTGTTGGSLNFLHYFGYQHRSGTAAVHSDQYITTSGCGKSKADADVSAFNQEWILNAASNAVLTVLVPKQYVSKVAKAHYSGDTADMCYKEEITIQSRMGSLIDSKAVAIGDRFKIRRAVGDYETRSVDKIWGSNLDVTQFSVKDEFISTDRNGRSQSDPTGQQLYAWIDESGSTEDATCSNRGLCDGDSGVCECFGGYTDDNCGKQNALKE